MRVILYNIEYCEGIQGKWYQYLKFWRTFFPPKLLDQKIASQLNALKPDLVALIEVDTGSFRAKKKDKVLFFEEKFGMKNFVEQIQYSFQGWLKLFRYIPILNKQAISIISKNKLINIKHHKLKEGAKRMVIQATIKAPRKITFLLVHLALGRKARGKQLVELENIVKQIKTPVILMGDFNTFKGEKEIDHLLKETKLNHKFKLNHLNRHFTQPAAKPFRILDYVLTSKEIKVTNYDVLDLHYSDHLPVMVDFEFK